MDWPTGLKQMLARTTPLIQRGALLQATATIQNALGAMTLSALKQQAARQAASFSTLQGMTQTVAQAEAASQTKVRNAQGIKAVDGLAEHDHASAALQCPDDVDWPAGSAQAKAPGRFQRVAFSGRPGALQDHYWLYVPSAAAMPGHGPLPLVLMLHGCKQNPQDFAIGTGMNEAAEADHAFVLYPAQSSCANRNSCWNWFRPQDQLRETGEPATLVAMVQEVKAHFNVDDDRIYAAGLSAGAAMTALLAREYPELFAAVGVHSGLQAGAAHNVMSALSAMKNGAKLSSKERPAQGLRPGAQPALIVFHGDADATVHVRNAEQVMDAALAGGALDQQSGHGQSASGQRYTRTVYSRKQAACAAASPTAAEVVAEQWLLHGAGHAWSGGDARGSYTDPQGVSATQEMLRFFREHPRKA